MQLLWKDMITQVKPFPQLGYILFLFSAVNKTSDLIFQKSAWFELTPFRTTPSVYNLKVFFRCGTLNSYRLE